MSPIFDLAKDISENETKSGSIFYNSAMDIEDIVIWIDGGKCMHSYAYFIYNIYCDQRKTCEYNVERHSGFCDFWCLTLGIAFLAFIHIHGLATLAQPATLLGLTGLIQHSYTC